MEKRSAAKVEVRGITSDIDQAVDGAQRSDEVLVTHFPHPVARLRVVVRRHALQIRRCAPISRAEYAGGDSAANRAAGQERSGGFWPCHTEFVQRRAMFRSRLAAGTAGATVALLAYLEASDSVTATPEGDDVSDRSTVLLFAGAMVTAITASTTSLVRHRPVPRHPTMWWLGLSLIWSGAGLNRLAKRELGANYRPKLTVVEDHQVVATGPYRYMRHPMYSGASLICLGAAMAVASEASVTWVLPVAALIHRITVEESMLRSSLGDDYGDFTLRRSRLVPGVW